MSIFNNKFFILGIILLFSITFISAEEFGYNYLKGDLDIATAINYTIFNVNDSTYWDGNAWSDTRWLSSYTETDPLWSANQSNYYNKTEVDTNISSANTSMKDYVGGNFIPNSEEANLNVNSTTWWANLTGWASDWFNNVANELTLNETKLNESISAIRENNKTVLYGENSSGGQNILQTTGTGILKLSISSLKSDIWKVENNKVQLVTPRDININGNITIDGYGNFTGNIYGNSFIVRNESSIYFGDSALNFTAKMSADLLSVGDATRNSVYLDSDFVILKPYNGTLYNVVYNPNNGTKAGSSVSIINNLGRGIAVFTPSSNFPVWNGESIYFSNTPKMNMLQTNGSINFKFTTGEVEDGIGTVTGFNNVMEVMNITNESVVNINGTLNMNNNFISNVNGINFNTGYENGYVEGRLNWDADEGTIEIGTDIEGVTTQVGRELIVKGVNKEGDTLLNGEVIHISGTIGNRPIFSRAIASNSSLALVLGMITSDCDNNQECYATTFGAVNDLNTSIYSEGDKLYLSPDVLGGVTTIVPEFPNFIIKIGEVTTSHLTQGRIELQIGIDYTNGVTFSTIGLLEDIIQTDYKIRSLEGHSNLNGKNTFNIIMNGTEGIDVPHLVLQPGGMGQSSVWVRSGIVVPEAINCLNTTNRTYSSCYEDEGNFTWNVDFNTSLSNGADWGITGDLDVVKNSYVGGNISLGQKITFSFGQTIDNIINGTIRFISNIFIDGNLNVTGETLLGNYSAGNFAEFNINGSLELNGNARVSKEIQLSIRNAAKGASAPSDDLRDFGASGTVKVPISQFSKVTQQDIYGEFHPKSDMDDSVDVEFHVMWLPGDSWTSGNYTWCLEYLVKHEESEYNTGTPTTICDGSTPVNVTQMIETRFTDTIDLNEEEVLTAHFYRDVANDDGDDTGDVRFIEISYVANKLGQYPGESI